ncbi:acyl carrier protein [Lactiplantibacillus plantarum]|uniref:acyl carrier protein n=1 Tax=Lactiplantibacillus plantarum TaxID=1590 RepID=UPI00156D8267|nr:phosphopantetheine-binding protein [Lactiplantibacillus plantarum]MBY7656480.1 acyl carrier protein [Lactiplantibacillus plantarum]QKK58454.1 acyl carrier protein [Lactiplantibacillus plantarum]QSE52169.1 acyl carrier protein [Lactiplantibacillus plantarum]
MKNKIVEIISKELNIPADDLLSAGSFRTDLNIDSLDIFQVTLIIQKEYGISINETYDTVDELVKLVDSNEK